MAADILVLVLSLITLILGIIGCVVPVIPGPVLAWFSLIIISLPLSFSVYSPVLLVLTALLALISQFLDNIFPVLASKKAGAGRGGIWGAVIGMIGGIFLFPPFGVFIGAFAGAYLGELLFNPGNKEPLKAALGVFKGTLSGILVKLLVCGIIALYLTRGIRLLF